MQVAHLALPDRVPTDMLGGLRSGQPLAAQPTMLAQPATRCVAAITPPDTQFPMILYCVRHGQSVYNAEGRIQGQSDIPLSDLGHDQSRAVAKALTDFPIDALYASPLTRAYQTAEAVGNQLDLPIETDARLKEIHAGIFQDKRRIDVEKLYPEETERWISEDPDYVIPGGESRRQLMRRGSEAFKAISSNGHQHVAIIAHGRLLIVTIKALLGIPPVEPPFALQNCSITRIEVNGGGRFELIAMNEVDHLAEVGLGSAGDL
jgi:probable phosphoglycerate mutase